MPRTLDSDWAQVENLSKKVFAKADHSTIIWYVSWAWFPQLDYRRYHSPYVRSRASPSTEVGDSSVVSSDRFFHSFRSTLSLSIQISLASLPGCRSEESYYVLRQIERQMTLSGTLSGENQPNVFRADDESTIQNN